MDDDDYDRLRSSTRDPYRSKRLKKPSQGRKVPSFPSLIAKNDMYGLDGDDEELSDIDDEDEDFGSHQNPTYSSTYQNGHGGLSGGGRDSQRYAKRRKLKDFVSGPSHEADFSNKAPFWSDFAKFTLLEVWGERFLQLGRKSVRSEDWSEISERVSEWARMEFSEVDCRHQLDALKKKYKKERAKMERIGSTPSWMHFRKMDMLMGVGMEESGLACGVDSGEFCFADTMVYLDKSNAFDEMRDSPCESESEMEEEEEDDDMPPPRRDDGGEGMRVLADSIERFGELYEKIESNKREQMLELKKMRANFQRELELQKKEILDSAQAEIAKIQAGDMDDEDADEEDNDRDEDDSCSI